MKYSKEHHSYSALSDPYASIYWYALGRKDGVLKTKLYWKHRVSRVSLWVAMGLIVSAIVVVYINQ